MRQKKNASGGGEVDNRHFYDISFIAYLQVFPA